MTSTSLVFLGLVLAFSLSSIFVPLIIRVATRLRALDKPDVNVGNDGKTLHARKLHDVAVPRIGGLGFFLAFIATYFCIAPRSELDLVVLLASGAFTLGFVDDLIGLSARLRLLIQIALAALVIWVADLEVNSIFFFPDIQVTLPPALAWGLAIFVVVGAINAFNMIDGMDGLATICGIITILALTALNIKSSGHIGLFVFAVGPIVGSLLGFLRSNIHPADIFMGDGGSNWIGFFAGVLFLSFISQRGPFFDAPIADVIPLTGNTNAPIFSLALLCIAIPVTDAASVIITRLARGQSPMKPDRRHIHHHLLAIGFSHGAVVSILGVAAAFFAFLGVVAYFFDNASSFVVPGTVAFCLLFLGTLLMNNNQIPKLSHFKKMLSGAKPDETTEPAKPKFRFNLWPRVNFGIIAICDVAAVCLGLYLGFLLRLDFLISADFFFVFKKLAPLAVVSYLLVSLSVRQYHQIFRFATLGTVLQLVRTHVLACMLFSSLIYFSGIGPYFPKSIILMQFIITLMTSSFVRFIPRMVRASGYLIPERSKPRCFVYGAGATGELLVRHTKTDSSFPYSIIGFIDDNIANQGKFLHGHRILGSGIDLNDLCSRFNVNKVLIAMPSLNGADLRRVVTECQQAGATPLLVPDLSMSIDPKASYPRPVDVRDLLLRAPKATNRPLIEGFLENQIILVTGAGGSIGSEICRQILDMRPKKIILLDASEYNLYAIHNELSELVSDSNVIVPLLGSITDSRFVEECFRQHQPTYVFHAAAYKHVHLVELNPTEAIINNVLGTKILASTAKRYKTKKFLLISTDKAVRPTSIMGASKRCCELLMQSYNGKTDNQTCFSSVRFGNVLGSSGSVVPKFMDQIKKGKPVTVTHPDVTRYFMLISEAVALVLQSIVMAKGGEIFVLNMGEAIRIYDMACQLIRLAGREPGRDIEIVFTGLRPGEKLYEELLLEGHEARTDHDDVFELTGGVRDPHKVLSKIDSMINCSLEGRGVEAYHILWSLAKHGNENYKPTLSPEVDPHASVN